MAEIFLRDIFSTQVAHGERQLEEKYGKPMEHIIDIIQELQEAGVVIELSDSAPDLGNFSPPTCVLMIEGGAHLLTADNYLGKVHITVSRLTIQEILGDVEKFKLHLAEIAFDPENNNQPFSGQAEQFTSDILGHAAQTRAGKDFLRHKKYGSKQPR